MKKPPIKESYVVYITIFFIFLLIIKIIYVIICPAKEVLKKKKKYDEFKKMAMSDMSSNSIFPSYMNQVTPMINHDKDLDREIRDRAIIAAVTMALEAGQSISYGDIRILVDNDYSEKEYESSKEQEKQSPRHTKG